ncbi:MAG: aminotransferase [Candidatus Omnitrophica bacterium CG11_big_fil_rev_8_21_14_0_20_63_9]|nr:MAG: aminotransferase [Candidatus Omnitrophica bacterium CG11_big_fil_rev_8_21_14_0_20_63_9]
MARADILLTPGPTPLPPQVREALARPIIHHRTSQYRTLFKRALQGMQQVMETSQPIACLTSSGTGAMEAAVVNLLSPGDEAVVLLGGKFAERWQGLCKAYGITAITVPVAYGDAVEPGAVGKALAAHPKAKAVFATLCETSTGVVHDIQAIAAITRKSPAVLVVDAISGLVADPCPADAWGVDVVVTGSQKGLMLPPGLAFISLSQRALDLVSQSKTPRFYTDLRLYQKALTDDDTPFTSAVSLVVALDEALKIVLERGLPQTIERCALMAKATRTGAEALGLTLFAKRPSNGVTAINAPAGIDGKQIPKLMYDRSKVMVAGGQGEMAGKLFRFAHMGYISPEDVLAGFAALEDALGALGYKFTPGSGIKAAQAVFAQPAVAGAVR